jgi:hypothetical protein
VNWPDGWAAYEEDVLSLMDDAVAAMDALSKGQMVRYYDFAHRVANCCLHVRLSNVEVQEGKCLWEVFLREAYPQDRTSRIVVWTDRRGNISYAEYQTWDGWGWVPYEGSSTDDLFPVVKCLQFDKVEVRIGE